MTTTVITTINETSFALVYADASALVLDGLAKTGKDRTDLFQRAKERARTAVLHSDIDAEQSLARQLLGYIAVAELQHWNA